MRSSSAISGISLSVGLQLITNDACANLNITELLDREPDARATNRAYGSYGRGSGRLELGPQRRRPRSISTEQIGRAHV